MAAIFSSDVLFGSRSEKQKAECIEKPNQRQNIIQFIIKKIDIMGQSERGTSEYPLFRPFNPYHN